jgi:hypothetical protein
MPKTVFLCCYVTLQEGAIPKPARIEIFPLEQDFYYRVRKAQI